MAREVLKTHQDVLSTRPSNQGTNYSDITFAPHGGHWREMRKVFVTEFLGPKRAGWFNQVLKMEIKNVINILLSSPVNTSVNLKDLLLSFVYVVVCKFAFGKSYREEPFKKEMLDESTVMLPTYGWVVDKLTGWNDRSDKCFANLENVLKSKELKELL